MIKKKKKKKKENGESVCVCVCARARERGRERTMDDICCNYKPNLGEQWMIYELILHPYIVNLPHF